jgi:hypothetical protein
MFLGMRFVRPSLGLVALTLACTKVNEQPAAPVAVAPVEAAPPAPKPLARRPVERRPWQQASAAQPAAAAPVAPAVPAGPPFSREKLQQVLEAGLASLNPCWPNGTVTSTTISFEATGEGKLTNVAVSGAPEGQQKCVADRLNALPLPTFAGPPVGVQLPISVGIRGLTQPADPPGSAGAAPPPPTGPAAATAAAPPPPPKLFITP